MKMNVLIGLACMIAAGILYALDDGLLTDALAAVLVCVGFGLAIGWDEWMS